MADSRAEMPIRLEVWIGSFATGPSQQQVRACPLCRAESGSNLRVRQTRRQLSGLHQTRINPYLAAC